jgi:glycine C-acetyltransferase
MYGNIKAHLENELHQIRNSGLYKEERIIASPQSARIRLADGREVLNMCANNYLGLSGHPEVNAAARAAAAEWGFGLIAVPRPCTSSSKRP